MSKSLDRIQLSSPCSEDWDAMIGNDQIRFCSHCDLDVYNLSALTRKDAERLVAESKGQLCVRYVRNINGQIVTENSDRALGASPYFQAMMAGTLSAALASGSAILAQTLQSEPTAKTRIEVIPHSLTTTPDTASATATIRGTVTDQTGAVVPEATITLLAKRGGQMIRASSNLEGHFHFASLLPGAYALKIETKGFADFGLHHLQVNAGDEAQITAALQIGIQHCETVEIKGSGTDSTTVGTLTMVTTKRGFWGWVIYISTAPYREGKKIFSRD
jgi:hypothetical protein